MASATANLFNVPAVGDSASMIQNTLQSISQASGRSRDLAQSLRSMLVQRQQCQDEVQSFRDELATLNEQKRELEGMTNSLEQQLRQNQQLVTELQDTQANLRSQVDDVNRELALVRQNLGEESSTLNATIAERERTIAELRASSNQLRQTIQWEEVLVGIMEPLWDVFREITGSSHAGASIAENTLVRGYPVEIYTNLKAAGCQYLSANNPGGQFKFTQDAQSNQLTEGMTRALNQQLQRLQQEDQAQLQRVAEAKNATSAWIRDLYTERLQILQRPVWLNSVVPSIVSSLKQEYNVFDGVVRSCPPPSSLQLEVKESFSSGMGGAFGQSVSSASSFSGNLAPSFPTSSGNLGGVTTLVPSLAPSSAPTRKRPAFGGTSELEQQEQESMVEGEEFSKRQKSTPVVNVEE